jgi:hypothetical protein
VEEPIPVPVPAPEGVIFPAAQVPSHLTPDGGAWTPSAEQVAAAERRLPEYLATAAPRLPASVRPGAAQRIAARLGSYARQYFGVSWAGRRLLYINCLLADHTSDWRARPVFVRDGGESFFRVVYDPELGEFSGLSVNGEA